jgi:hypothetical protein
MLDTVLLDRARLENAPVISSSHLADSRSIRKQVLKKPELAQQPDLFSFDFFRSEQRWAAGTRIHNDDAPALFSQHRSERNTSQTRSDNNDFRGQILRGWISRR